jgi:16S rRNA (uracil1498-N3)-methyltransferase
MARELRRLLIPAERLAAAAPAVAGGQVEFLLTAAESRYLTRVLRYGPGDRFAVLDGAGGLWGAQLLLDQRVQLEQPLQAPLERQAAPRPRLVLAAAVVKRDFEVVVRMAVELGVDHLLPLQCERTAVQGQLRPERWRSIAAEAAEQCERLWLPQIAEPCPLPALLERALPLAAAADPPPLRLWATTRRPDRLALVEVLRQLGSGSAPASQPDALPAEIWLACGPEGGWSEAEERQALASGWRAVDLGPRILRSSTACVAGLSELSSWRGRLCGC